MNQPHDGYVHQDETAPGWGDRHPHLTIRASAGSGKTYQLSTRYLFLVRHGFDPSHILATTFTRKAAGEVLGRVITRLADAVVDEGKRAELSASLQGAALSENNCRAMLRTLTGSLHRLSISTIDGFFNRIAQSFRHELDLPPEPKLIDEKHPVAVRLRQDAIEAMLADDDLPALVTLLRQLHHDTAARSVTEVIDSAVTNLYEVYREAPDRGVWSRLKPLSVMDEDSLQSAVSALAGVVDDLPSDKRWLKAFAANREAVLARDWEGFIKTGLAGKLCEGSETYYNKPFPGPVVSAYEPLLGHAAGVLIQRVAKQTKATHDLLRRFDEHYSALRRRQGVLLFSDLTHKLSRELPELGDGLMEDVYYRLDGRVTHLLLDEFQDTSLSQWAVLRPFAEEVAATADGTRSLFCVGDTKQAIYGWRGGVAELFDEFEDSLGLGEQSKQTLSTSYRSSGVVLDAVNEVFADIASNGALANEANAAERWQKGFAAHEAARELPGHVTLETSTAGYNPNNETGGEDDPDAAPMPAGAHEIYVAQKVKALYGRSGGAGSIGVLVSVNKTASRLIYELGKLGLPVSGEGGSRVSDSPAVMAVLSALVMADHPGDTASAFHVLNSPLGKVVGLTSIEPASVRRASLGIRRSVLTRGYAHTITGWTRAIASSCDARGLKRLTQLIELADRSEPNDALRPSWFVDLVESARVAEPSPAPIRVMTIHGAKGLEFDTVVLAELDRGLTDRSVVLVERASPTGPITGVYRKPDKKIRALDEKLEQAAEAQRADRLIEDLCSLYVAMTRARQALHMVIKPVELTRSGGVKSKGLCFASILRAALGQHEETIDGEQVLYKHGERDWTCAAGQTETVETAEAPPAKPLRFDKPGRKSRRSWPTVSPSSQAGLGDPEGSDNKSGQSAALLINLASHDSTAMRYGTLIHAWMQLVGFIDEPDLPEDDGLHLVARRVMPGTHRDWVASEIHRFRQLLASPKAKDVLVRDGASELWRERGFAVHDRGTMLRGFFDRVSIYSDDQGQAIGARLVDFKTDRVEPGGIKAMTEHYRPQMLLYRRALMMMLGLDTQTIKMKLWFVGSDHLVDL